MRFTLVYDGELPANGNRKKIWEIRKFIHPQLKELWNAHPALQELKQSPNASLKSGSFKLDTHHSMDHMIVPRSPDPEREVINLCEPVVRNVWLLTPGSRTAVTKMCAKSSFLASGATWARLSGRRLGQQNQDAL
jgi:hypothetical protein